MFQDYISLSYLLFYLCVFTVIFSYFRQSQSRPDAKTSYV